MQNNTLEYDNPLYWTYKELVRKQFPLDKIDDANFITIGWTVRRISSYTSGRRNYWKIPWKMSKRFLFTASFKLKVIKYAKNHGNRAAETLWTSSHGIFEGNRKKSFSRCQHGRQCEGNLQSGQRWSRRWRPRFQSGIKLGSLFWPRWYKKIKGLHEKKTLVISQEYLNGALTLWEEKVLSMCTWRKLAEKLPAAYENQVLVFCSYVTNLWKTYFDLSQIANMDEVPLTFHVPSNRTVDIQGAKTVAVETGCHEKSHFTVVLPGVFNLLASLRHNGRRVVLGHTLYTLQYVITKKSHNILSKFMICVGPHS